MAKKQLVAEALIDLHRRLSTLPTRSRERRMIKSPMRNRVANGGRALQTRSVNDNCPCSSVSDSRRAYPTSRWEKALTKFQRLMAAMIYNRIFS